MQGGAALCVRGGSIAVAAAQARRGPTQPHVHGLAEQQRGVNGANRSERRRGVGGAQARRTSQPERAAHRTVVRQCPLLPLLTSLSLPVWAYGVELDRPGPAS